MLLYLKRFHETQWDTLGLLYIDGVFSAFVVEDEGREEKVMHETRIPGGRYKLGLRFSPKFSTKYGHDMIEVKDVPGFTGILIHRGNSEADTSGCLLLGNGAVFNHMGKSHLTDSTGAYNRIYNVVRLGIEAGGAEIVINNPIPITGSTVDRLSSPKVFPI